MERDAIAFAVEDDRAKQQIAATSANAGHEHFWRQAKPQFFY